MEAIRSSETSVYTISTWRQIPEDGILHNYDYPPIIIIIIIIISGERLSPLRTAATTGLLYQPQMMMVIVEKLVEWRLAGETEVIGENLPQRHFVHPKSHMTRPGPPRGEASD
jgi:hypothetical protein